MNVNSFTAVCVLIPALLIGVPVAASVYDQTELTCSRHMDREFLSGRLAIWERCTGKLGMEGNSKLVKYVERYTFTDVDGTVYEY